MGSDQHEVNDFPFCLRKRGSYSSKTWRDRDWILHPKISQKQLSELTQQKLLFIFAQCQWWLVPAPFQTLGRIQNCVATHSHLLSFTTRGWHSTRCRLSQLVYSGKIDRCIKRSVLSLVFFFLLFFKILNHILFVKEIYNVIDDVIAKVNVVSKHKYGSSHYIKGSCVSLVPTALLSKTKWNKSQSLCDTKFLNKVNSFTVICS